VPSIVGFDAGPSAVFLGVSDERLQCASFLCQSAQAIPEFAIHELARQNALPDKIATVIAFKTSAMAAAFGTSRTGRDSSGSPVAAKSLQPYSFRRITISGTPPSRYFKRGIVDRHRFASRR